MQTTNISGYSDDIIEVAFKNDDGELVEEEYDSYDMDTLFDFDDGTRLRMTYRGAWMAVLEKRGTAKVRIEPLIKNDDWYSDLVTCDFAIDNQMEPDDTLSTIADNIKALLEISTFNGWERRR